MVLSFEQSGSPVDFSLAEVKDLAVAHRITRQDGAADLDALFKLYGVKALSTFKKKFTTERLLAPAELKAQPPGTPTVAKGLAKSFEPDKPIACEPLPLAEFEAKSETSVWEKGLKWRLIMRPGGAYIQPDDWYRLYAASNQAKQGDNTSERPMWADHGGIDFHGRASWDAWTELKGTSTADAQAKFCRVWAEAHTEARFGQNFHNAPKK